MTTIDTRAQSASADDRAAAGVQSVGAWLTTTDHKRLGRIMAGCSLLVLAAVGVVAALLGIERITATSDFLDSGALPQMFSLYRIGLTFGVLLPLMLGITMIVVPLQIGGRSLTFARVASAGTWAWLMGFGLMIASILANGGPGGGDSRFVALYLASMLLMLPGVLAVALSMATTILTARAPGMNMRRVPMFTWSALIACIGLVLAVPVLLGTTVYTYIDYRGGRTGFGGNTGIMEWLGFGSSQMMTFVYALPVFGFAAETVATATRQRFPMRTTAYLGMGLVGVAALGAVTQNTADLRVDILDASFRTALHDILPFALFNLLPLLGGVVVLGMCALALSKSRPALGAPLVFGLCGLLMLLVALAANVVDRIGDAHLGGTVFEEGVWIAIVYGAVLCGLGALAYWGPKVTGRVMPTMQTVPLALLGLLGAALASLPYFVAGFAKQPANATQFSYGGPQELWNVLVSIGHALMVVTALAFVGLFARSARRGAAAGDDPWDGQTLEWATSSPAPEDNFPEVHIIASAEPLIDLKPVATSASVER